MCANIDGSGNKTIVMLSDWNVDSPMDEFFPLYEKLKKEYKVIVLEYFGYFGSDITSDDRTNNNIVNEIRSSLEKLNVKPPYILMPAGMSGLYSLYYAKNYSSEISAIIGLDMSLPAQQLQRWNEETFDKTKLIKNENQKNISVINQWNSFYTNSKELENIKYPENLPVLSILSTEKINEIDNMVKSGEMKTSLLEINKNMVTNSDIQKIEILESTHDLAFNQYNAIFNLIKNFIN